MNLNHRNNNMNKRPISSSSSSSSSSYTASPYAFGTKDQKASEVQRTMLEQENDTRWMELGEQVSLLKAVKEKEKKLKFCCL